MDKSLKSELKSMQSRISHVSKRAAVPNLNDEPTLEEIKEETANDVATQDGLMVSRKQDGPICEVCQTKCNDSKDIELNKRINAQLRSEDSVRRAYNEYRRSKGLDPVDYDFITKKPMVDE